ncbi:MAG: multiheme c-type cytochrome, partial [Bryobacteraceae bacterium]
MAALLLPHVTLAQHAGSEACRKCHAAQFAAHAKTGHARALRPAPPEAKADWAFGSGLQAVTYVSRIDEDFYFEHGLTLYTATGKLGITPGHRTTSGERYRIFDPGAAILRCFQCHSTGPLGLAEGSRIQPFEVGVQCETCHGPGAEHASSQKPIRNPKRLSAAELNSLCGG